MRHDSLFAAQTARAARPALPRLLSTTRGQVAAVLLGSLFVAVCAQVAVPLPWTPVPMTMQPFGVLLVGLVLGPFLGAASLATYLLESAAGLPVLVPGFGGLLPLGASAGYLLSYPLAAAVAGGRWHRGRGLARAAAAAALGNALILLCGAGWLAMITHSRAASVLQLAVLPFVAADGLKVLLAAAIASGLRRQIDRVDASPGA